LTKNQDAIATGGTTHISNSNINLATPEVNVKVKMNPQQEIAPKTSSQVKIDSHNNYKYLNRQFLPSPTFPSMGVMQDFLPPKIFGFPWNYLNAIEGKWKKCEWKSVKKIKVKELKKYCYLMLPPTKEVVVITDHHFLLKGKKIIGEVIVKGRKNQDSREIQMAVLDILASWGANVIFFQVNTMEHQAESTYSGIIIGGATAGLMAGQEKVATTGSGGIGQGSSRLRFIHFPVVHAIGYHGKILKVKKETEPKERYETDRKNEKWQIIQ